MSRTETTNASMLLRLRNGGDEASWRDFHARYGHLLYRYARSRGAAHAEAEDAAQEVLMRLVGCIDQFDYDPRRGRFRGYLRTAVVHELGRRARRDARQPAGLDPQTIDLVAAEREADADEVWQTEWRLAWLRTTVQDIAGEFDQVTLKAFEMFVLAGCPANDTAEKLGISKWRVYRARQRVLRRLSSELGRQGPSAATANGF